MPKLIPFLLITLLLFHCCRKEQPEPVPVQPESKPPVSQTPAPPPETTNNQPSPEPSTPPATPREKNTANQKLREAAEQNEWETVADLLKSGADVNFPISGTEPSLLILALLNRQPETARFIIETPGVNLNVKSASGASPLALAEYFNYTEILSLLTARGQKFPNPSPGPFIIDKTKLDQCSASLRVALIPDSQVLHIVSPRFERFHLVSRDDRPKSPSDAVLFPCPSPRSFTVSWSESPNACVASGKKAFILMNDTGFEIINSAITIWDILKNGRLQLDTILDRSLSERTGETWIRESIELDDGDTLLIGESMGADGQRDWGSWWIGLWRKPRAFRLLHRETYSINQDDNVDNQWLEVHFEHQINGDALSASLWKRTKKVTEYWEKEKKESSKAYEILDESFRSLDLRQLILNAFPADAPR